MPNGGYEVDPRVLESAARTVRDRPKEELEFTLPQLRDVRITPENFGPGHLGSHSIYVSGVQAVVKCVDDYLAASEGYADSLTGAGRQYSTTEEQTQSDISQAGGA